MVGDDEPLQLNALFCGADGGDGRSELNLSCGS